MKGEEILDLVRYYTGDHSIPRYVEVNEAYRDILKTTKWWFTRIQDDSLLSIIGGNDKYKVDFSKFRGGSPTHVYIRSSKTSNWSLIEEAQSNSFEVEKEGRSREDDPTTYFLSGDSLYNFRVTPTPCVDMEVRFDGVMSIKDIDRDVTPVLHKDYHNAISLMASGFILQRKGDQESLSKGVLLEKRARDELKSLFDDAHPNRLNDLNWNEYPLLF